MEYYLAHHGILGMKWGVRRYQNKDGSLTEAGKKRYLVGEKRAAYREARKTAHRAYNLADQNSIKAFSPVKAHREEYASLMDDFYDKNKLARDAKGELLTAEKEFKGAKLKEAANTYRTSMLKKYVGKDPKKYAFYTNASDELIQKEFLHRENVKKAIVIGAAAVGIGAAGYLAYRMAVNKRLSGVQLPSVADVKDALTGAQEDLDYVIKDGSTIHRMVGFKNFDVTKAGDRIYATVNDSDRAAYALFLKDWSGSGERYDVTLKAVKDIVAPSDKKARKIFDEVWTKDPTYRRALEKTLRETYAELMSIDPSSAQAASWAKSMMNDPFGAGMYAFVRGGEDSKILQNSYTKRGYSAIVDYFDRGSLGKLPMILFDPKDSVVKVGETKVTQLSKQTYAQLLAADKSHPMYAYRHSY